VNSGAWPRTEICQRLNRTSAAISLLVSQLRQPKIKSGQ